jgi:hypothetical protein
MQACEDSAVADLADLHPDREAGGANFIWRLFDKFDDLRPLLKKAEG